MSISGIRKEVDEMRIPFMKHVAWYLVVAMFIIGIAPRVDAGIAPSELISLSNVDREAAIERIQRVIETKMIRERLEKLGFTQEEIRARLTQLSDQQLHQLALKLDDIKVGGDLGVVIALLMIAVLVVILLQLTGRRVIVTK